MALWVDKEETNMKQIYENPIVEIVLLHTEDILTTSPNDNIGEDDFIIPMP